MKRTCMVVLFLTACPLAGFAQGGAMGGGNQAPATPSANPVSDVLRSTITRYQRNMVGAAQAMPGDKYDFKPTQTAGQMSFAELIAHIANSNMNLCSRVAGTPNPQQTQAAAADGKDKLVAALQASFDYCTQVLAKADDSNLGAPAMAGGRGGTKANTLITLACDWYDHYSSEAGDLRLNGILPPSAAGRGMGGGR
jgi:hypothetical protein